MTSINTLASRVARLHTALQEPHRTISILHEVGSDSYTLSQDGSTVTRLDLDKLQASGHFLVIREYPQGYLGGI